MYKSKFILGVIPARGGSKGIPKKNIKPIAGKPLIAWSIEEAKAAKLLDKTIVSTDSAEIADVAKGWGGEVPFLRPAELAQDSTPSYPVLQHAITAMEKILKRRIDIVVLIDPTSPTRVPADIDACIRKVVDEKLDCAMTVYESDHNPYYNMVTIGKTGLVQMAIVPKKKIYCRQDAPKVYNIGSDVYAVQRDNLIKKNVIIGKRTGAVIVSPERAGGIDNLNQFRLAEMILDGRNDVIITGDDNKTVAAKGIKIQRQTKRR